MPDMPDIHSLFDAIGPLGYVAAGAVAYAVVSGEMIDFDSLFHGDHVQPASASPIQAEVGLDKVATGMVSGVAGGLLGAGATLLGRRRGSAVTPAQIRQQKDDARVAEVRDNAAAGDHERARIVGQVRDAAVQQEQAAMQLQGALSGPITINFTEPTLATGGSPSHKHRVPPPPRVDYFEEFWWHPQSRRALKRRPLSVSPLSQRATSASTRALSSSPLPQRPASAPSEFYHPETRLWRWDEFRRLDQPLNLGTQGTATPTPTSPQPQVAPVSPVSQALSEWETQARAKLHDDRRAAEIKDLRQARTHVPPRTRSAPSLGRRMTSQGAVRGERDERDKRDEIDADLAWEMLKAGKWLPPVQKKSGDRGNRSRVSSLQTPARRVNSAAAKRPVPLRSRSPLSHEAVPRPRVSSTENFDFLAASPDQDFGAYMQRRLMPTPPLSPPLSPAPQLKPSPPLTPAPQPAGAAPHPPPAPTPRQVSVRPRDVLTRQLAANLGVSTTPQK